MRPSKRPRSVVRGAAAAFAVALAAVSVNPGPARGQASDTDVAKELAGRPDEARRFVKEYLAKNPEVLQELVPGLRRPVHPPVENRTVINSSAAPFVSGKRVPLGNPKGDIALVEFVDYNCMPCKRALPLLLDLVKADSGLAIFLIHHPILGPGSVEAARIAIALQMQVPGAEKYPAFHEKLLAGPGPVNKARALAVAAELGIDAARLEADAARPEVDAALEDAKRLVHALGLRGVPSYVVGDNIINGTLDAAIFKTKISVARQQQLDSLRHCDQSAHPDLKIAACSNVIARADLPKEVLAKAYLGRCEAYGARRQHDRAILDCNEAIELNPAVARAFASRSAIHAAKRRHALALADIGEAIRLDPKAAHYYVSRGTLRSAGKAFADALADFDAAIDIDPRSPLAYVRRGNVHRRLGQPDRAIADYDEAIRLQPRYAPAHVRRADTLREKHEYERAVEGYGQAITLQPQDAFSYYLRGGAFSDSGQHDKALADYTDAVRLNPRLAVAYNARAWTWLKLGKASEGLPDVERALELQPKLAQGYDTRAHIHEALGRREEAIADFRRALALMPALQRSLDGLQRLGAAL
jgi:tetratricopeptide (TPR) repeat protein